MRPARRRIGKQQVLAIVAAMVLAMAAGGCALEIAPQPVDPAVELEVRELQPTKLDASARIEIDNPFGDIRVRAHDQPGMIRGSAAIQRIGPHPPEIVRIDARVAPGRYSLAVAVPGADRARDRRAVRIDLVLYVPDAHSLRLATADGTIRLKNTRAEVRARSETGTISIVNDGPVDARTRHGSIELRPLRPGWGELELAAGSGRVILFLPEPERVDMKIDNAPRPLGPLEFEPIALNRWQRRSADSARIVDRVRVQAAGRVEIYPVQLEPMAATVDATAR